MPGGTAQIRSAQAPGRNPLGALCGVEGHGARHAAHVWLGLVQGCSSGLRAGVSSFIAGAEYAHGGISLQECLVPVIQLDSAGARPNSQAVMVDHRQSVTWKGLRCTVVVTVLQ
jgi:hypothetical protein